MTVESVRRRSGNGSESPWPHIHRGRAGVKGDIVVDLTGSVTAGSYCAKDVRKRLIRNIAEHPRRFYFNVHNEAFPAGAIRGQLHR